MAISWYLTVLLKVSLNNAPRRRLLILAYSSGFQLWDCTNLASVTEVLNLNAASSEWLGGGEIVHVAVLPSPSSHIVQHYDDPYAEVRPLLGIV